MPKGHLSFVLIVFLTLVTPTVAPAQEESPDERARQTESQMTDDERFSLLISLSGATRFTGGLRDKRYPNDAPLQLPVGIAAKA